MHPRQISSEESIAHSLSFNDYNARLFQWNGGLYRGIRPQVSQLYRDLFERGIVDSLVGKKLLIETELTSDAIADYELVLQHRQLPFVSYPWEWCDLMLQDAALLHLDLCLELDNYDLTTGDAHPLNILFDGCRPIFIDFGSIQNHSADSYWLWIAYEQFCHFFLNPLKLMARGKGRIARWLLHDYERGVLNDDLEALTIYRRSHFYLVESGVIKAKSWIKKQIPLTAVSFFQSKSNLPSQSTTRSEFLNNIRQVLLDIDLTANNNQPDLTIDWLAETQAIDDFSHRREVTTILSRLQPTSVLEIDNYHPQPLAAVAASLGSKVVFLTPQEHRARELYLDARTKQLYILPLLFDLTSPSCDLSNRWFTPASDRLKCDLVLALDLVDRLVFKQYLTFPTIVERLAIFCDRWLLVEFITREYPYRIKWSEDLASRFTWYCLDNFIASLKSQFEGVEIVANISDTRVLLLCEKRSGDK
jgi:hypothetical protein